MSQFFEISADVFDRSDEPNSEVISDGGLQRFLEIVPFAAFVVDDNCQLIDVNSAGCRFLGYERGEVGGKGIADFVSFKEGDGPEALFRRLSANHEVSEECEFLRRDQKAVPGDVFAQPLTGGQWLVFVNDLSSSKQAEMALRLSEEDRSKTKRSEVLESLAGGIAHDFNNFLAVILLHTDMMKMQLADDSPLLHRVDEIKAVSNDAAGIVHQLLAFARKQKLNPAPQVLNKMIEDSSVPINALVGDKISVELGLSPDLGVCFVDLTQIAQTLMYLAVNAKDAMPEGGLLKIETSNVVLDRANTHKAQPGGSYVQIAVSDSGKGMDATTGDRIFDPFFSTKGSDRGAGLGLATVYGIVKQTGGFIWVESEPGRGATFKIQFPRIDQPELGRGEKSVKKKAVAGNETILLVDDDQAVRRVAAEILRNLGFRVFEAVSGVEAVEIARSMNEPLHLILTDYSMPDMDGCKAAQKIKKEHPESGVLFISGTDIDPEHVATEEKAVFLTKPFSSAALIAAVNEVLGQ